MQKAVPQEVKDHLKDKGEKKDSIQVNKFKANKSDVPRKPKKLEPKAALLKLESRKAKLEKLKGKDSEKAKKIVEKQNWNAALAKAQGIKLQDDEKLLKKTIKRKEKAKFKSAQEWFASLLVSFLSLTLMDFTFFFLSSFSFRADRKKDTAKQIKTRLKKREEMIKNKIDAKKNKRLVNTPFHSPLF